MKRTCPECFTPGGTEPLRSDSIEDLGCSFVATLQLSISLPQEASEEFHSTQLVTSYNMLQHVTTIQTIHDTFLDQSSCPNVSDMPIAMDQNPPLLLTPK